MTDLFHIKFALDTFYFLVCGALVMWMAAGFTMLEAGLVRAKNTTEILTKNIALYAISCTLYLLFGYAIMYQGGWALSGISALAEDDVIARFNSSPDPTANAIYSQASDFFFQVVFVATCMSIVSGAVAERMKLWSFLIFCMVMTGFIYPLEGYWTWGGGQVFGLYSLNDLGFSDFAGSGIVHMAGAAAALSGVLILGPRQGKYSKNGVSNAMPGANLPLAALGTLILWVGWFGFNGGSVLKLSDITSAHSVALVFVNTNAAAAGGTIAALLLAKFLFKKADLTMTLNGALAGLVVITADPLSPSPLLASALGALGGITVVYSILLLDKLKIDDPVGAISVHGVCGILGLLLVPLSNDQSSILGQIIGASTIFLWVFIASSLTWWILNVTIGIRVDREAEHNGMDIEDCGMEAYPEFTRS